MTTGSRDLRRVMVTSAVAPIAFYSALDAFRILVAHERRHMAQAERVIKADGFPERRARPMIVIASRSGASPV